MTHGLRGPRAKKTFTNNRNILCHFSFQSNFLPFESSCAFSHSDNSGISAAHSSSMLENMLAEAASDSRLLNVQWCLIIQKVKKTTVNISVFVKTVLVLLQNY